MEARRIKEEELKRQKEEEEKLNMVCNTVVFRFRFYLYLWLHISWVNVLLVLEQILTPQYFSFVSVSTFNFLLTTQFFTVTSG